MLVPLTVVMARRPQPVAPIGVDITELFATPPSAVQRLKEILAPLEAGR